MTENQSAPQTAATEPPPMLMAEFLESVPPSSIRAISDVRRFESEVWFMNTPDLQLFCESDECKGSRFFAHSTGPIYYREMGEKSVFLEYACRNCGKSAKTYAVLAVRHDKGTAGMALKIGEWPVFGPPTPSRLVSLVGPDREAFLKGRRSEKQGLGIGAFAYYRRVVENQKNRLLDEIIRVAERSRPILQ